MEALRNNCYRFCACGNCWKLKWWHYIVMLFKDINITCKVCGRRHRFHMTYFVNEKFTKQVNGYNKAVEENKKNVLRRG